MGRINGINSDYKFKNGAIEEVKPTPDRLELKLFICPNNQKNSIEADPGACEGRNASCQGDPKLGHAMLHMDQQSGITLETGNTNRIQLEQSGKIILKPGGGGQVEMRNSADNATLLSVQNNAVVIAVSGARVEIKTDGSIELTPANGKPVKITGNLTVTGTVNGKTI